jgi:hypothetical protein
MPAVRGNADRSSRTRASIGISTAVLLVVTAGLIFLAGWVGGSKRKSVQPNVPAAATPVSQAPATPRPQAPSTQSAVRAPAVEAAPLQPGEAAFWDLTEKTRSAAGNDTGKQTELLKEGLIHRSPQEIITFAQIRHRLDQRAYTSSMWGAASVIEDGCSDDCFRDFRSYVISLGRGPFERALQNPDSLASVAQNAETGDWENADNVAPDAYSSVTGGDFPLSDSDLSGRPRGAAINRNDAAGLARRYPRLAARFR